MQDHIEALGISPAEFAQRCHCPPELIGDIISGFGVVDSYAATEFGRETGLVKHIWLGVEEDFRRKLADFRENTELSRWAGQFPVKELVKRGAVSERSLTADPMARMMSFYNFWSLEEWEDRYGPEVVTYRNSPDFDDNRKQWRRGCGWGKFRPKPRMPQIRQSEIQEVAEPHTRTPPRP